MMDKYDSVFSAYKEHWIPRWTLEGKPDGWSTESRPMRQDRKERWVENGAVYITSRKQLEKSRLRYSGNIGILNACTQKLSNRYHRRLGVSEKMLELTSFRNKHKGKDIYVFGSGPSCDFIDPSFVNDKITVGTNQTWRKYNTNYVVRKEHNLLQETLDNFAGITLVSMGDCGSLGRIIKLDNFNNKNNLCIYKHLENSCSKVNFQGFDKEDYLTVSYSTITTSIHFAYYLGAKNIFSRS